MFKKRSRDFWGQNNEPAFRYQETRPNRLTNETIFFTRPETNLKNNDLFFYNQPKIIYLLKPRNFNIFNSMNRLFTITTNNGSYKFNIDFLKETSHKIRTSLEENPQNHEYHLNTKDEKNVMIKIEKLYLGQQINITNEERYSFNQIICELDIINSIKMNEYEKKSAFGGWQKKSTFSMNKKIQSDLKGFFEVDKANFINFIKEKLNDKIAIVTKSNEYKCIKICAKSSKVISDLLSENPNLDRYEYDFDDEFGEFQLICDLFNIKSIEITADNMNTLKMLADDLQIECITNDIDKFIDDYDKRVQVIDDQQTIIDSINELFDTIYRIKEITVDLAKNKIVDSNWSKTEENVQELAAFILQAIQTDILLHHELADLIEGLDKESSETNKLNILIPFIVKKLMTSFGDNKFTSSFVFILYQKGFIEKGKILKKFNHLNKIKSEPFMIFIPEIYELCECKIERLLALFPDYLKSFIQSYFPDKIELFIKMRESGEPDDQITKALRSDDVDTLQSIISLNHIKLTKAVVPINAFEEYVQNGQTSYINYAAAYGSLKCFKYLLLNHAVMNNETFSCALFGGNIEIVKIVDQNLTDKINYSNEKYSSSKSSSSLSKLESNPIVYPTIIKHKNDLFDWIIEQKFTNIAQYQNIITNILYNAASNGNCHSFTVLVDKGIDLSNLEFNTCMAVIQKASTNGFYRFLEFVSLIMIKKIKSSVNFYDVESSISFGNLLIFQFYIKQSKKFDFNSALLIAVKKEYRKIIEYILENEKEKLKLSSSYLFDLFCTSIKNANEDTFQYLIGQIKSINHTLFLNNNECFINILAEACSIRNMWATKIITNLILENKKDDQIVDFSRPFYKAILSNSIEICQFLIDKKVFISFKSVSLNVQQIAYASKDVLELFIKNMTPDAKEVFNTCYLNEAIYAKNVFLVEYLLNENIFYDNALYDAVNTGNINIVNLILAKNSKPSFVNQVLSNQTALNLAIKNQCLDIIDRLLSIPGIDLNLPEFSDDTPIITAIFTLNVFVLNKVLDFYGPNIKQIEWKLNKAFKKFLTNKNEFTNEIKLEKAVDVLDRLIDIDCIDLNYYSDQYTLLCYACIEGEVDLIKKLISLEKVDVNLYSPVNGNTPLMLAIERRNSYVAKLLINCDRVDLNRKNFQGVTAFMLSVQNDMADIAELIITNDKFDPYQNCLDHCFRIASKIISDILLTYKCKSANSSGPTIIETELMIAIETNEIEFAKKIIKSNKININQRFNDNQTFLTRSVVKNLFEIIDLIVNNEKFDPFESRLDYAFFLSDEECSKKLIKVKDLDVNYRYYKKYNRSYRLDGFNQCNDNLILTTLVSAVNDCDYEKIELIIGHPSFDKSKSFIDDAIFKACEKPNFMISSFKKLINLNGDDVNIINSNGCSLFEVALVNNNQKLITEIYNNENFDAKKIDFQKVFKNYFNKKETEKLIDSIIEFIQCTKKYKISINCSEYLSSGCSYFTEITYGDDNNKYNDKIRQVVDFLLENGANPNAFDKNNMLPLEHAIKLGWPKYVSALIDSNKIDFSFRLKPYNSYLNYAINRGDNRIIKLLIRNKNVDVNEANSAGDTALIDACRNKRFVCIKLLFERDDLDYLHKNNSGDDALSVAQKVYYMHINKKPKTKDEYYKCLMYLLGVDADDGENAESKETDDKKLQLENAIGNTGSKLASKSFFNFKRFGQSSDAKPPFTNQESNQSNDVKQPSANKESNQSSDAKPSSTNQESNQSSDANPSFAKQESSQSSDARFPSSSNSPSDSPSNIQSSSYSAVQDEIIAVIRDSFGNVAPDQALEVAAKLSSIMAKQETKSADSAKATDEIKPQKQFKFEESQKDNPVKDEPNCEKFGHQERSLAQKFEKEFEYDDEIFNDDQNQLNFADCSFYQNQFDQQQWNLMIQMNNMRNVQFDMIMHQQEQMLRNLKNDNRKKNAFSTKKKKKNHK